MFVSEDKSRAFATAVLQNTECNGRNTYIKLKGLIPDAMYSVNNGSLILSGATLMNVGIHRPANIAGTTAYTYIIERYTGADEAAGVEAMDDATENGYLA
jgi:alpha-galactosidase